MLKSGIGMMTAGSLAALFSFGQLTYPLFIKRQARLPLYSVFRRIKFVDIKSEGLNTLPTYH
jgi:hypothetical protein